MSQRGKWEARKMEIRGEKRNEVQRMPCVVIPSDSSRAQRTGQGELRGVEPRSRQGVSFCFSVLFCLSVSSVFSDLCFSFCSLTLWSLISDLCFTCVFSVNFFDPSTATSGPGKIRSLSYCLRPRCRRWRIESLIRLILCRPTVYSLFDIYLFVYLFVCVFTVFTVFTVFVYLFAQK